MRKIFTTLLCAAMTMTALATPFQGALSGLFTINANGDQVRFSQGNLQYQPSTQTWRFAANQYDTIGTVSNNQITQTNTSYWMDIFGWGTGDHPQEWLNSDTQYFSTYVDWGTNDINNAYSSGHLWRTMSIDEWNYVCFNRPNAADLLGLGTVNGIAGAIILPDGWTLPDGAAYTFTPSSTRGLGPVQGSNNYENANLDNFTHNTFDADQWAAIEATGAVFFPAAGTRYRNNTSLVGQAGCYHTSSIMPNMSTYVHGFVFEQKNVGSTGGNRYNGQSVRLVIPKEPQVGDTIVVGGVKYKITDMSSQNASVDVVKQQDYTGTSLVIPASIEYYGMTFNVSVINQDAFRNNTNITSVDIACTTILSYAFGSCPNLETITLHEGLHQLQKGAFSNLPKAKSIHIPSTVNSIAGSYQSNYQSPFCRNQFETITIEEGNIWYKVGDDGALYTKDGKKLIAVPTKSSKLMGVIPEGVEEIVSEAFYQCPMADTVVLPSTLIKCPRIFASSGAKCAILNNAGCSTCTRCFYYLSTVQEIILGPNCKYLGECMFYNSDNVRKITILSDTIPEWQYPEGDSRCPFGSNLVAASDMPYAKAKVYVRCGLGDTFRSNTGKWANFSNIIDTLMYNVTATAGANGSVAIADTTDCDSVRIVAMPAEHYEFDHWSNGLTDAEIKLEVLSDTAVEASFKKARYKIGFYKDATDAAAAVAATRLKGTTADYQTDVSALAAQAQALLEIPNCAKFIGWTKNGTDLFDLTSLSETANLYPKWQENATFTIVFKNSANDELLATEADLDCGDDAMTPAAPDANHHWQWSSNAYENVHADATVYGTLVENGGTAIDTVTGNPSPVTEKVLRNGQLLIIHNGRTFNALGAEVK